MYDIDALTATRTSETRGVPSGTPVRMAYSYYKRVYRNLKNAGDYDKNDKSITVYIPEEIMKSLRPRWYYEALMYGHWEICYVNAGTRARAIEQIERKGFEYRGLAYTATYNGHNGRR